MIKMCSLLMSRSVNVREAAGKTLIEIAKTLGPKYLPFIVREMKQNMKKGFQVCWNLSSITDCFKVAKCSVFHLSDLLC